MVRLVRPLKELAEYYPLNPQAPLLRDLVITTLDCFYATRETSRFKYTDRHLAGSFDISKPMIAAVYRHSYTDYDQANRSCVALIQSCVCSKTEREEMIKIMRWRCRDYFLEYLQQRFSSVYRTELTIETMYRAVTNILNGAEDDSYLLETETCKYVDTYLSS